MFYYKHCKRRLLAALAILLSTQACINPEDFDPDRIAGVKASPSVAIPLMYGELTIGDLLPEEGTEYVQVDEERLLHVVFSDTLNSTSIRDYFLLPPLNFDNYYSPALGGILPGNQQLIFEDEVMLDLTFPDADLETIALKSGKLVLTASSSLDADMELLLSFPTAKKGGEPLTVELSLPANSIGQRSTELDLRDFNLDLSDFERSENYLPVQVKGKISSQEDAQLSVSDHVYVDLAISNINYSLLTGYFGKLEVSLPKGEVALDGAFDELFSKGKFGLKNPSLSFDILNSNGIPVQGIVNSMKARNKTGKRLDIRTNPASPFLIAFPHFSEIGQTAKTPLNITNVGEILDLAPSHIEYDFSGVLNPESSLNLNFITDSSFVSAVLHADVPLWGYMEGIRLSNTMAFPLEVTDVDVEEASLRVLIENEFPLGADVQVYFTNEFNQPIDSLFDNSTRELIRPSTVTADGELQSANKYTLDIPYSGERFARIMKAKNIITKVLLYTSRNEDGSQPHVKIKDNHRLKIQIGARADNLNIIVEN